MFSKTIFKTIVKKSLVILVFILLLSFSTGCFINDDSESALINKKYDAPTMAVVNAIIDSQMASGEVPGALVGIWQDGYETQFISKGFADIVSARPPAPGDRFRIASNTKMFTAMGLLMLADQKKINLDDKVFKYISDYPHTALVTIRQLANHSSGYFNYTEDPGFTAAGAANLSRRWTAREMLEYIKDRPLNFTPGTNYSYSNTNYVLMGLIIEAVSGLKWEDYIKSKIINSLMLSDTYYPADVSITGSHMKGYNVESGFTAEIILDPSMGWAAGGFVSTLNDMKKWLDALASHSLISPSMFAEQLECIPVSDLAGTAEYGFGVLRIWSKFIGHTGVIPGYNSAAFISMDRKQAVVVVFNNEKGNCGTDAAFKIAKFLFQ